MLSRLAFFAFLVCIILPCQAGDADKFFRRDYTYDDRVDGWTKMHRVPAPWHEARKKCALEGAILASPVTEDIRSVLHAMISKYDLGYVYTGLHATFARGEYFTIDGIPLHNLPEGNIWQPGGLNYSTEIDHCLVTAYNGLANADCRDAFPYLCFKKYVKLEVNEDCGTTDQGYKFNKSTGSCYKLHDKREVDWSSAFEICAAENAYLAIPNDDEEAVIIGSMLQLSGEPWVGVTDWENNDHWYTVHGQPIEETYSRFSGLNSNAQCATISRAGILEKTACALSRVFLCEKDPKM